jgi:hypothetical protein
MGFKKVFLLASLALAFQTPNMEGRKESEWGYKRRIKRPKRKSPLTPKQQKARAKAKRASKERNKLRAHPNYHIQLKNERKSRSINNEQRH